MTRPERSAPEALVRAELALIADPEIPAISVVDLGVIGDVAVDAERVRIELLPTFVGCPAVGVMREEITRRIGALAIAPAVDVVVSFDPPWTSDRISQAGRERLRLSGFAPPPKVPVGSGSAALEELAMIAIAECPYCGSRNTTLENAFGPTLCRSIHHCAGCRQAFEQFKRV